MIKFIGDDTEDYDFIIIFCDNFAPELKYAEWQGALYFIRKTLVVIFGIDFFSGECPKGHNCTSISQKHFRLFLHTEQAYARSDSNKVSRTFKSSEALGIHVVYQ